MLLNNKTQTKHVRVVISMNAFSVYQSLDDDLTLIFVWYSLVMMVMIIIITIISIAPYLTDKGVHTALYKINNNVCIKTSKIINYIVIILYSLHTYPHTFSRYLIEVPDVAK